MPNLKRVAVWCKAIGKAFSSHPGVANPKAFAE